MERKIFCNQHGLKEATFVCQHIANSLKTKVPIGFFWAKDSKEIYPDAWCENCNNRVAKTGGEWEGKSLKELKAKVLCSDCYIEARKLALGY